MKPETIGHVETARRNRDIAEGLLTHGWRMGLTVPPFEWVAVVAFYSAVHYINAFIWEMYGVDPRNHPGRRRYVETHAPLTNFRLEYIQLEGHSLAARYNRGYRISDQDAQDLLTYNLAHVEAIVCRSLGTPSP